MFGKYMVVGWRGKLWSWVGSLNRLLFGVGDRYCEMEIMG